MKIAPDIDALMWNISDTRDETAADNFGKMFPDLKTELSKRMHLVHDIRQAKQLHVAPVVRPAFVPKERMARSGPNRTSVGGAFCVAAAVAFGAYLTAVLYPNKNPAPSAHATIHRRLTPVIRQTVPTEPAPTGVRATTGRQQNSMDAPTQPEHVLGDNPLPFYGDLGAGATPSGAKPDKAIHHLALQQVSLADAVRAIGAQAKLDIALAPNMPSATIDADYDDTDAISVLKDLGAKYGFGVVIEGPDDVLLVPESNGTQNQN